MMIETQPRKLQTFSITLKSSQDIAHKVKHFVFHCENFHYVAGQFITLIFEKEGRLLRRSYSIATQPEYYQKTQCIEFAASYVENGPASELLFNLKPGDVLEASGPFGRLILKEEMPKRYIFVSTSTGVTPYRAMLGELAKRMEQDSALEIILLEGVQYKKNILYAEDFLDFAKQYSQFQFYACYSRENAENLNAHEHLGYVQSKLEALNLNPQEDVVYLCGNPGMIDDAFLMLKEKQFDVKNILREKYISNNK